MYFLISFDKWSDYSYYLSLTTTDAYLNTFSKQFDKINIFNTYSHTNSPFWVRADDNKI